MGLGVQGWHQGLGDAAWDGVTGNVGRGWGMLLWLWRVIRMPFGAGSYRDAAMGVPPACVPMGCSTVLPCMRGDLNWPNLRVAQEANPSPLPGILESPHSSARVP